MDLEAKAFAKLNLHLEVLNRREDGYHNIFGLFANINLFDLLKLDYAKVKDHPGSPVIRIKCTEGKYKAEFEKIKLSDNLIYKSVWQLLNQAGKSGEYCFSLVKNIPLGGGLGGGSSDASCALKLINKIVSPTESLDKIASNLGADVRYCLKGGYAICEGIGDEIDSIEGKLNYYIIIANSGINIDTGHAYRLLNRDSGYYIDKDLLVHRKKLLRKAVEKDDINIAKDILDNHFEKVIIDLHPEIGHLKDRMKNLGSEYTAMTGSGSTIFGLYRSQEAAITAAEKLKTDIDLILVTKFV